MRVFAKVFILLALLCIIPAGGCIPEKSVKPDMQDGAVQPPVEQPVHADPVEEAVAGYLDCTAEAAIDAVLDGSSLVQSQLALANACSREKVNVLSLVDGQERASLVRHIREWDLQTIQAVRERLVNLEDSLKSFMDCGYSNVRELFVTSAETDENRDMDMLMDDTLAACYRDTLFERLHPNNDETHPLGLARKEKITLLAKERIMQELYNEIQREKKERMQNGNRANAV